MTAQAHTKSALVTGGADGIGAGLSKRLSALGYSLTLLDINPKVRDVAGFLAAQGGRAFATECDVVDQASQERAFRDHASRYGSLDIAIINAGIMESGDLLRDEGNAWKQALRVNLEAVMVGVRLAVRTMVATGTKHGIIMVVASAGGIYPMPVAPVYSSAKAGSVMLTRSLGPPLMRRHGIRICALCPQFTDTALVRGVRTLKGDAVAEEMTREVGGRLLSVDQVVDAGVALLMDDTKVGECAVVLASGDVVGVQRARFQRMGEPLMHL